MTVTQYDSHDALRLYDQPEPAFRFTPRTAGAAVAVGLIYAGVGALLNVAGIQFVIPRIVDEPEPMVITWTPPAEPAPKVAAPTTVAPLVASPAPAPVPTDLAPIDPAPVAPAFVDAQPFTLPVVGSPTPIVIDEPVAPPAPPAAPVIRNPDWLTRPSAEQLGRLYPTRAAERGMRGRATMECRVTADGSLTACFVVDETPRGYGFGEAALASTRYFRMSPKTVDGQAVEGAKVRIPMGFNLAG